MSFQAIPQSPTEIASISVGAGQCERSQKVFGGYNTILLRKLHKRQANKNAFQEGMPTDQARGAMTATRCQYQGRGLCLEGQMVYCSRRYSILLQGAFLFSGGHDLPVAEGVSHG